jgi:hypothetical protein
VFNDKAIQIESPQQSTGAHPFKSDRNATAVKHEPHSLEQLRPSAQLF